MTLWKMPPTTIDHLRVITIFAVAMTVIGTTAGIGAVGPIVAAQEDSEDEYVVVQDGECTPIEPLGSGERTVEEFYDYRTPETEPSAYSYSSHGTVYLQEDDTSTLFLFDGSDGLSLVVVHDQYDGDSAGGSATMEFEDLPEEGEWVVEDDDYSEDLEGGSDDVFDHAETTSRISWTWSENRSDGAAFNGGLDDEFAITIDPAFNEEAELDVYDGRITDWHVVSNADDGRERTPLALDEPIVVSSGGCTSMTVADLETDDSVTVGEAADVSTTVENDGWVNATYEVAVSVDGDVVEEQNVTIDPGESETITSTLEFDEAGIYTVAVGDESTTVTVTEESDAGDENDGEDEETNSSDENEGTNASDENESDETDDVDSLPGFGAIVATLAIAGGAWAVQRRS